MSIDRTDWPRALFGGLLPSGAPQYPGSSSGRANDHGSRVESLCALTGRADGPPVPVLPGFVARLEWLAALWATIAPAGPPLDPLTRLTERAADAGFTRHGTTSCGGATRILRAADVPIAVSLARTSDLDALPALVEGDLGASVVGADRADDALWTRLARRLVEQPADHWIERAMLLGMPLASLGEVPVPTAEQPAVRTTVHDRPSAAVGLGGATVDFGGATIVDLSSLWAGPLCAYLLGTLGAHVIKVEGASRPDGARTGPSAFYERLHAGHESITLDFTTAGGRRELTALLHRADIVIEASRPRALEHLGIDAGQVLRDGTPHAWLSITGYGRAGTDRDRAAFGDDAAFAGGLVAHEGSDVRFLGDAIADPLTGMAGACAIVLAMQSSQPMLLDVALSRVAAAFADCYSFSSFVIPLVHS